MEKTKAYQAELERSETEHHLPTAGAMIGHITANLFVHSLKIEQAFLFAKGPGALFLAKQGQVWLTKEIDFFQKLNVALAAEGNLVPTTSKELLEFSMLTEDGAFKYACGTEQLFDLIKDFDTQLLFITRALKLAQKEEHYGQIALLQELYAWIKEQIAFGQKFLDHDLRAGLYTEEEN